MGVLSAAGVVAGYSSMDMVLKGIDLAVGDGEIVAIIGPNGAGKSTFLKAVAGLVRPSRGTIDFLGSSVAGLKPREITRRGLALVPQEANVFGTLTVRENLEMGGYIDPAGTRARVPRLLERFPVLADKRNQAARTLSGGQRQVLAMAMALMVEPRLLLLDEPSAGLSPIAAADLFATIREINGEGVAIAMVEQNALEALEIAHRAYILVDGRTHRTGGARELAGDPEVKRTFLGL